MVVKKKFVTQPTAIASFDFVDIASGTGTIVFQLATTQEETTLQYIITPDLIYLIHLKATEKSEIRISKFETNSNTRLPCNLGRDRVIARLTVDFE